MDKLEADSMPAGWVPIALADVASNIRTKMSPSTLKGMKFIGMEHVEPHTRRLLGSVPAESMKSAAVAFLSGDILYGRLRPYLNKVFRPDFEGCCSAEFIPLTVASGISPTYIERVVSSTDFVRYAGTLDEGDRPRVDYEGISAYSFGLPPASEQRRIVAKLDALQSRTRLAREALAAIPTLLEHYRQSVLSAAFSGDLSASWRSRNGSVLSFAESLECLSGLGKIKTRRGVSADLVMPSRLSDLTLPSTWLIASTSELLMKGALVDVKDGNHGANHPLSKDYSTQGMPFIMASHVRGYRIDYQNAPKIEGATLKAIRVGFANPKDVILTHKGTVGRVAVCDRDCVLTPQTTYYRCRDTIVDPEYLAYFISSPVFQAQLVDVMSQTTRNFVPISQQYEMFHILPPVEEQREIARVIKAAIQQLDMLASAMSSAQSLQISLEQSILATAFRGELVPQDPADEPASVLLDRIRAARAQASDIPRTRRPRVHAPTPVPSRAAEPEHRYHADVRDDKEFDSMLAALRKRGSLASSDAQAVTDLGPVEVRPLLQRLVAEGHARVEGQKRGTRYVAI